MAAANNDAWFGVYQNVANAQDWVIKNDKGSGLVGIDFFATGGVGDITVILADNPNEVTQKYHSYIVGHPTRTPQWALGWHQGRRGYRTLADVKAVYENYNKHELPLDSFFLDIDYMHDQKAFSVDRVNFDGIFKFVEELK